MKVVRTIAEMDAVLAPRRAGAIGFVPTMGALHEGHLSLLRACRERCDTVVMSIFVNPLQFGPGEDFDRYPRSEERDLSSAEAEGVDVAFLPSASEMYPAGAATTVGVGPLGARFEGAARPGHFDGVATVVAKLFNIVRPDLAYFGQKDAQQAAVIRRMVADLAFPVEIAIEPTVREPDGLALSSRNVYLSPDDRERAAALHRALRAGSRAFAGGDDEEIAVKQMHEILYEAGVAIDYAAAVDPDTFENTREQRPVLLIVAARVGNTRLIDNVLVERR